MKITQYLASPRAANMLVFAGFGAVVGTFSGSIPVILRQSGMSSEMFGLALTGMSIATVTAMTLGGLVARYLSYRAILLLALPISGLILVLVMQAQSAAALFGLLVVYGAIIGLTDCIMNAEGSAIEHDLKKPVFTAFHASVSLAIALSAITSSVITHKLGTLASCAVPAVAVAIALWSVLRSMPARPLPERRVKGSAGIESVPLVLMGLAIGFANAAEMSAVFWSAELLHELAPDLAAISGLGVAFFSICAATVRFPGDALRARFGDLPLMMASLATAIAGFVALWLSPSFAFSVFAFALVGLGLAIVCPCLFNLAAKQAPHNRASGIGFASVIAAGPRILAPYFFGWLSGVFSISAAFGACAVITFVAFVIVLILSRQTAPLAQVQGT
jgi:predicted MFS family arabinose efflux permease